MCLDEFGRKYSCPALRYYVQSVWRDRISIKNRGLDRDSNQEHPEYEAGALTTGHWLTVATSRDMVGF
jgi:hypothetical protein